MNSVRFAFPVSRPSPARRLSLIGLGASALAGAAAMADGFDAVVTPNLDIPDASASGLVSVLHVPPLAGNIADVNVTLTVEGTGDGGWNGDLYVYLAHGGALTVLVNRPGVTADNSWGYGDNGLLQVRFDDEAAGGDVHLYQEALGTGDTLLPLTGAWEPDARDADPEEVLGTSPRNRFLDQFDGLSPEGEWRLFVADLSAGGTFRLVDWKLDIELESTPIIPETREGVLGAALVTLTLGAGRWLVSRRRRGEGR